MILLGMSFKKQLKEWKRNEIVLEKYRKNEFIIFHIRNSLS